MGVHGIWAVAFFKLGHSHQGFVDGSQKALVGSHGGARWVGFSRLGRDKQESALLLESLEDFRSLDEQLHV